MSTQASPTTITHEIASRMKGPSAKILVLGATSGIAEATCRIWAAQGASLFLVARNPEKLVAAIAAKKDNLYVPFQWQPIMFIIRNIPDRIFKKLNL